MIKLLLSIFILTILSACSSKNAFTKFDMSQEQERSVSSLLSSKIKAKNGDTDGIFSAVYLNEIYPDSYHTNEYFFVYYFLKNKKQNDNLEEISKIKLGLSLNGELPMKVKQLKHKNKFSKLTFIKSDWNRYYLVAFKKQEKSSISLVFENGPSSSDQLKYQKGK